MRALLAKLADDCGQDTLALVRLLQVLPFHLISRIRNRRGVRLDSGGKTDETSGASEGLMWTPLRCPPAALSEAIWAASTIDSKGATELLALHLGR